VREEEKEEEKRNPKASRIKEIRKIRAEKKQNRD
jgi:hypothetical protein